MSALKVIEGGKVMELYSNDEELPLDRWRKLFVFGSPYTVSAAARRAGVPVSEGPPPHPGMKNTRTIRVGDFPGLVRGFQQTGLRRDKSGGHHFHPWSLSIDHTADEIRVERPDGPTLEFTREE